jgi:hypothetical protein
MKAKRLLDAIAQDLSSVSLSSEFPANVAKLKLTGFTFLCHSMS